MSTLIEELKQVPDFRKSHGRSHPLWILLLLMVMGILAGYQGYRPLHTFAEEHQHALCELFGLKQ
ncbi:transposase family protein, partial [Acaryochloris thomasi]|uniref:transposase family protein n=1 Tax=Acaryochloris thomasi TaxID=2929456 RepID=UPI0011B63AA9